MGFMIGLAGVVVLALASLGGFLVSAGSRSSGRAVVAVLGAVCAWSCSSCGARSPRMASRGRCG